jgi:alkylated DNA repair dioxygenase AlkB
VRDAVSERLGGQRLNHALIQWYRSGHDHIGEHADKTLDVRAGSVIVNVSFGATRCMVLRTKDRDEATRRIERVELPHNSLFVLGLETNRKWKHEINPDKRLLTEKASDRCVRACVCVVCVCRVVSCRAVPCI